MMQPAFSSVGMLNVEWNGTVEWNMEWNMEWIFQPKFSNRWPQDLYRTKAQRLEKV